MIYCFFFIEDACSFLKRETLLTRQSIEIYSFKKKTHTSGDERSPPSYIHQPLVGRDGTDVKRTREGGKKSFRRPTPSTLRTIFHVAKHARTGSIVLPEIKGSTMLLYPLATLSALPSLGRYFVFGRSRQKKTTISTSSFSSAERKS